MEPDELYFCSKCNKNAETIVMIVNTEMELNWNEKDKIYEIGNYFHDYEETKSITCGDCMNNLMPAKELENLEI